MPNGAARGRAGSSNFDLLILLIHLLLLTGYGHLTSIAAQVTSTPQSPQAAIEFYLTQLQSQGFTVWQPHPTSAVFTMERPTMLLCHQEKGIQLSLSVRETPPEMPTDVRLAYDTNPIFVSCDEDIDQMTTYAQTLLPELTVAEDLMVLEL